MQYKESRLKIIKQIADPNDYSWIKIQKYTEITEDNDCDFKAEYFKLLLHHTKETTFLIKQTQDLADEILSGISITSREVILRMFPKYDFLHDLGLCIWPSGRMLIMGLTEPDNMETLWNEVVWPEIEYAQYLAEDFEKNV
jgi:hypothetical protein